MSQGTYAYYSYHFGHIFDWALLATALDSAQEPIGGHRE